MEDKIEMLDDFIERRFYYTCTKCKRSIAIDKRYLVVNNITADELFDLLVSHHMPCYGYPLNMDIVDNLVNERNGYISFPVQDKESFDVEST